MDNFTTMIHVTGSARNLDADMPYLRAIVQTVHANHAIVFRDWLDAAASREKNAIKDADVEWETIFNSNLDAIKKSDLVIVEATQARFNQGMQTYIAAQYKRPTLVVTRTEIQNHFISGIEDKYVMLKRYSSTEELENIVSMFIKQYSIPEKDLRFNMSLSKRAYRFLRDTSYESGKNKSDIVREILENEINKLRK